MLRDPIAHPASVPARDALEPLRDPIARRLHQLVLASPGAPCAHLMRELGVGWNAFYRRVALLVQAGLLRRETTPTGWHIHPTGQAGAETHAPERAFLRAGPARILARAVCDAPGLDAPDLLRRLEGHSPRVLYYHLRRLERAGLVTSTSPTRYQGLQPTPLLLRLLAQEPVGALRAEAHAGQA